MEKYAYQSGMKLIIAELETMAHNNDDRALLCDYKSAYEHICNQYISAALEYELQAVNLCDENTNPHLIANIYANTGGLYHASGDVFKAKEFMEKAYYILTENNLQYTADSIAQICNYANLAANLGESEKAITALKKCVEYTEENSGIYAELLWNTGIIYLQMNDKANAVPHLKKALNIYAEIYEDEPELTQRKISELQDAVSSYGIDAQNLISEN